MKVIIPAIILLALAFIGFAVRILLKKDGQFRKSCSTMDNGEGDKYACKCSGKSDEDESKCEYFAIHHPEKVK